MFADDVALIADSKENLQHNDTVVEEELAKINMDIFVERKENNGASMEGNEKLDKKIHERMRKEGVSFNQMRTTLEEENVKTDEN
ncbi:hypothetical protein JTB14_017415 [Gonioctena quinquepunctata]|nr:hypothetical protein JTB14_017415 [Gonioctena quinquepunctata]